MTVLTDGQFIALVAAVLAAVWLLLHLRSRRGRSPPRAVIDGSNVMHWNNNAADLAPVVLVVDQLRARGYRPSVIFDANAGYKLVNRYQGDAALAAGLSMPASAVFVVPKGEQADPFLLRFARDEGAILISNDRFRDRIADYPELARPGRLVRGGASRGRVWLDLAPPGRRRLTRVPALGQIVGLCGARKAMIATILVAGSLETRRMPAPVQS